MDSSEKTSVERSKSVHVTLAKKDSNGRKKVKCTSCMEEVSSLSLIGNRFHWDCKKCGLYGDFYDEATENKKKEQLLKMKRRMSLPASQLEVKLELFGKNGGFSVSRSNSKASSGRARRASIYDIEFDENLESKNKGTDEGKEATSSYGPEDDGSYFGTETYDN